MTRLFSFKKARVFLGAFFSIYLACTPNKTVIPASPPVEEQPLAKNPEEQTRKEENPPTDDDEDQIGPSKEELLYQKLAKQSQPPEGQYSTKNYRSKPNFSVEEKNSYIGFFVSSGPTEEVPPLPIPIQRSSLHPKVAKEAIIPPSFPYIYLYREKVYFRNKLFYGIGDGAPSFYNEFIAKAIGQLLGMNKQLALRIRFVPRNRATKSSVAKRKTSALNPDENMAMGWCEYLQAQILSEYLRSVPLKKLLKHNYDFIKRNLDFMQCELVHAEPEKTPKEKRWLPKPHKVEIDVIHLNY